MKKYFLSEQSQYQNHAGSKARDDLEKIIRNNHFEPINKHKVDYNKIDSKLALFISRIKRICIMLSVLQIKNSLIIFQYPLYFGKRTECFVEKLAKRNKICYFVHDVNSIRNVQQYKNYLLHKEIKHLNNISYIVLHNQSMINELRKNDLRTSCIDLEVFDYISEYQTNSKRVFNKKVAYAGNLEKGSFIYQIKNNTKIDFTLNVYGPNFEKQKLGSTNIIYKGSFTPEQIVYELEGAFGLIWDGKDLDTCTGGYGEYTRYNSPHKLSLYIAAQLPVIVWKESAAAIFVEKYNIGFCIESIYDIANKFEAIDESIYEEYLNNLIEISKKVKCGFYTTKAISEILKELEML